MDFLPWKTVDLDGAFRVTAPESISEELIQEVSNAVTFRFSGTMHRVRLEILLTPPWGWEECFPSDEQQNPPARFICRLISRSTGRRLVVPLLDDGLGLWFAETEYTALLDGEEIRVEALLVRSEAADDPCDGYAVQKGQIVGRSRIHTVRFTSRTARSEALFQLRWSSFPSGASQQLWRLQPGEPPVLELNEGVTAPLRRLLMSRGRRRSGAALQRDAIFMAVCSAVWPLLVSGALNELQRIVDSDRDIEPDDAICAMNGWQSRLLGLFAPGLTGADLAAHAALPLLVNELRTPGGFMRLMMRMPALIQEETRLVVLAEAMAAGQQIHGVHEGGDTAEMEVEAA